MLDFVTPNWPAPLSIRAFTTTRLGGCSSEPFDGFNLADHVGDELSDVLTNREALISTFSLPSPPVWLNQTHSVLVANLPLAQDALPNADASMTSSKGVVCAVMTADCLPILLTTCSGGLVGAVHAGWRGLADGIVKQTVDAMRSQSREPLMAWIGPSISQAHFEVGDDVYQAFVAQDSAAASAFVVKDYGDPISSLAPSSIEHLPGQKWLADLPALAIMRLIDSGLRAENIYTSGLCTFADKERFFSYRREGQTGRIASLIWIE